MLSIKKDFPTRKIFYVNQMTVEEDIQYLRESATLKVMYDDLGSEHLSHDPDSVKSI